MFAGRLIATFSSSQADASSTSSDRANTAARGDTMRSERNAHPRTRQHRELGDRATRRAISGVVVPIDEHVLRIVDVHDAQVWRERRSAIEQLARHIQVEAMGGREARTVVCRAELL